MFLVLKHLLFNAQCCDLLVCQCMYHLLTNVINPQCYGMHYYSSCFPGFLIIIFSIIDSWFTIIGSWFMIIWFNSWFSIIDSWILMTMSSQFSSIHFLYYCLHKISKCLYCNLSPITCSSTHTIQKPFQQVQPHLSKYLYLSCCSSSVYV